MDDIGRMHVVTTGQDLEHKILEMIVCQILSRVDDSMHISLHQLKNDVNIFVICWRWRLCHIKQFDDILVVEELEELDLSNDSLGINQVFKSFWHLLDSYFNLVFMIIGTANHSICAMTDLLYIFKFLFNTECCT